MKSFGKIMKTFRNIAATVLMLATACTVQEQKETVNINTGTTVFLAEIEMPDASGTKVYADDNLKVLWHADDRVSVFNKLTYNQQYKFDGNTGDNSGSFSLIPEDGFVTGNELDHVYAVYPYSKATKAGNSGLLTVCLPSVQPYAERSFGHDSNVMVAATDNNVLLFRNLCGYLMLKLYGEGLSVSSIKLTATGGEVLAGTAAVTASPDTAPVANVISDASSELMLECVSPVALGSSAENYTEFWFVVPPVTMSQGFSVLITLSDGRTFEKSMASSVTIARNHRSRVQALEVIPEGDSVQRSNEIWYTTASGNAVVPNDPEAFGGAAIVSNIYKNGKGVLTFDSPLTEIGERAFFECSDMVSITIPDGVVSIGESAFLRCGLSTVNIPESVENLAEGAFAVCSSLKTFTGRYATANGDCLVKDNVLIAFAPGSYYYYIIPSGIERIGMAAFAECVNLQTVIIPESVKSIGFLAFASSSGLKSVIIESANPPVCETLAFDGTSDCPILVPAASVDSYRSANGWFVYANRINPPSADVGDVLALADNSPVNLQAKVYAVGSRGIIVSDGEDYLFVYTTKFPCSIGDEIQVRGTKVTYRNNPEITNVCLVIDVLSSGHDVTVDSFTDITNELDSFIAGVAMPVKLTGVVETNGSSYYIKPEGASKRVYVYWPNDSLATKLGDLAGSAVTLCGFYLFNYSADVDILPVSVKTADEITQLSNEIWYTSVDGSIVVPSNPDTFGAEIISNTYEGGKGIISFNGPVTMLGDNNITSSSDASFCDCSKLKTISLPSSVRSIGSYAFHRCTNLVSACLPGELDYIGSWVFVGSDALTEIEIPRVLSGLKSDPIGPCASLTTIKGEYASSDGKCLVYNKKLMGFARGGMEYYQIPEDITALGTQCFASSRLQRVSIPDSVEQIDDTSFEGCSEMVEFRGKYASPDGRCIIKNSTLLAYAQKGISDFTVPDGVTNLARAFDRAVDLKVLHIPSSVSRIQYMDVSSLKTVYVYSKEPPVAGPMWLSPEAIYVPNASVEDYKTAKNWSNYADCIKPMTPEPEAVDLGLDSGLKWASWNLGASGESQRGLLFAWGETMSKSVFTWLTYKWGNAPESISKYNCKAGDAGYDNKLVLDPEDDAASVLLGSGWSIPSKSEWDELKRKCDWAAVTVDGVDGYRVTSRSNGKSIFLPAQADEDGWYWTSALGDESPQGYYSYARAFCVNMTGLSYTHSSYGVYRMSGCSIRPVRH